MKLPNYEKATIRAEKLTEYLLSESHPVGFSKAAFFRKAGYVRQNVTEFMNELRAIAGNEVSEKSPRQGGVNYTIIGLLKGSVKIKTVWTIDEGSDIPRFVTAYPHRG